MHLKRNGILLFLLFVCAIFPTEAETRLTLSQSDACVGDVIDVRAETEKDAVSISYTLTLDGKTVFSGKEDTHFISSFRPRSTGRYILEVFVRYKDGSKENASADVLVSGTPEPQPGSEIIYSQKDGWWKNISYSSSELETAGCAIFTLSHALQRMGFSGEDILPESLAESYANCYTKNGTANARLIHLAAEAYAYTTTKDLMSKETDILDALRCGDYFSFGIVNGHIALVCGVEGDRAKIVDSAPGATFERIRNGKIYYLSDGEYHEAFSPEDIPGARYYFETSTWGGLEYYMDLDYLAKRGVRLIRPAWLLLSTDSGEKRVILSTAGSALCTISLSGIESEVPAAELTWLTKEGKKLFAVVNRKNGAKLINSSGKRIASVPACTILPVFLEETDRVQVIYKEQRGYLSRDGIELVMPSDSFRTGRISLNGSISGRAKVKIRYGASSREKAIAEWKTGTKVAVISKKKDFYQVEANGLRAWVQETFLTLDE